MSKQQKGLEQSNSNLHNLVTQYITQALEE